MCGTGFSIQQRHLSKNDTCTEGKQPFLTLAERQNYSLDNIAAQYNLQKSMRWYFCIYELSIITFCYFTFKDNLIVQLQKGKIHIGSPFATDYSFFEHYPPQAAENALPTAVQGAAMPTPNVSAGPLKMTGACIKTFIPNTASTLFPVDTDVMILSSVLSTQTGRLLTL